MRKLVAAELALLTSSMMIGHAHGQTQMGEIVVTASSISIPAGAWVSDGGRPSVSVGAPAYPYPSTPVQQTAIACAKSVATQMGLKGKNNAPFGPAPGYAPVQFSSFVAYHSTAFPKAYMLRPISEPPPVYLKDNNGNNQLAQWQVDNGLTNFGGTGYQAGSWVIPPMTTEIFASAYSSLADLVGALIHEFTHENLDTAGESAAQKSANEATATANGNNGAAQASQTPGCH